jgi:hypothetical protein
VLRVEDHVVEAMVEDHVGEVRVADPAGLVREQDPVEEPAVEGRVGLGGVEDR